MAPDLFYPKGARNTVHRKKERASYALEPIHHLINRTPLSHVSFNPSPTDPFPTTLPMIAVTGSFERPSASEAEVQDIYLHTYVSSRLANLARAASSSSSSPSSSSTPDTTTTTTDDDSPPPGVPVSISAAIVDSLILSLTPMTHSYAYRSCTLHGLATLVPPSASAERLYAMRLITNKVVPSRYEHTRTPPDAAELASTAILRVRVLDGSYKAKVAGVSDEKKDLEDEEVVGSVWTGVVPVKDVLGDPVPSKTNRVAEVPAYLGEFVTARNDEVAEYAERLRGLA
ncbi:MAG: hypothetical protein M1819_003602 [Sarea resinae]|nr:MAG: hypothetical protein M1819_003602 [Sarea resinae]